MPTLADFKRRLKIGVRLHTIFHRKYNGRDNNGTVLFRDEDKGIREVSIVQTNAFALRTTKKDGTVTNSWCQYPKASEVQFVNDNTLTILESDSRTAQAKMVPVLTYTFIE